MSKDLVRTLNDIFLITLTKFTTGGGFGGKETRSCMFSSPVAVAANKYDNHLLELLFISLSHRLKVPVRVMLDRNEDMMTSGTRHPFLGRYKVCTMSF